jgi:hypothetical protein
VQDVADLDFATRASRANIVIPAQLIEIEGVDLTRSLEQFRLGDSETLADVLTVE